MFYNGPFSKQDILERILNADVKIFISYICQNKKYALKESSESFVNSRQLCSVHVKLKVKTVESCKILNR